MPQQFSVENLEISFLNISTSKMSNFQLAHIQKDPICQANLRKMKISQNDIENAGTRPRFSLGNPEIALSNTSASKMSNLKIVHAPPKKSKFTIRSHSKKHVLLRQESKRTIPENDVENTETRQQFSAGNPEIAILNISTSKMSNFKTAHVQKDAIWEANL